MLVVDVVHWLTVAVKDQRLTALLVESEVEEEGYLYSSDPVKLSVIEKRDCALHFRCISVSQADSLISKPETFLATVPGLA